MKGKHGAGEFFGDLHAAERFAVALGVGHAEAASDFIFGGTAFEVGEDHDFPAVEACHAAGHRGIVAEGAVAVNLTVIGDKIRSMKSMG